MASSWDESSSSSSMQPRLVIKDEDQQLSSPVVPTRINRVPLAVHAHLDPGPEPPAKRTRIAPVPALFAPSAVSTELQKEKAGKEKTRRTQIKDSIEELRSITGCAHNNQADVLSHSVDKLQQFHQWQQKAVQEIKRLRRVASVSSAVAAAKNSRMAIPPPSSNVVCLSTGKLLQIGYLLKEWIEQAVIPPDADGSFSLTHFCSKAHGEKWLAKSVEMIQTGQQFFTERHKCQWRGHEILCTFALSIVLDSSGRPFKYVFSIHPLKIGPTLPNHYCDANACFCHRFCLPCKPVEEQSLTATHIAAITQALAANAPGARLEEFPIPVPSPKLNSSGGFDIDSFMSAVDPSLGNLPSMEAKTGLESIAGEAMSFFSLSGVQP